MNGPLPKSRFQALMEELVPRIDQQTQIHAALSFFNANVREKRRRIAWVMRLSDEYRRVEAIDIYGTSFMLTNIEQVIDGDFVGIRKDLDFWKYDRESEQLRARYVPLHAPWLKLLEEYLAETEANLAGLGDA